MEITRKLAVGVALIGLALPSAAWGQTRTVAVEAGPIWSQADAERKCPEVAKTNGLTWNGQWRTTVPGRMSVCELRLPASNGQFIVKSIEAGPIGGQMDAERRCPEVAKANGGIWTGHWKTTVWGRMSVCDIRLPR